MSARHGDVHQITWGADGARSAASTIAREDRLAAGGGGDHHIGLGQCCGRSASETGVAAAAVGEVPGRFQRAVGHDQAPRPGVDQVAGRQLDGLAGADQQHTGLGEVDETLLRQARRWCRRRTRAPRRCACRCARAWPREEGVLQQALHRRLQRMLLARDLVRVPTRLRICGLAQHHGVSPWRRGTRGGPHRRRRDG